MAYMIGDEGPYPNKAGEYCGNHLVGSTPISKFDESPHETATHRREHLAKMRFGRPHSCKAATSDEMAKRGYVGLYLKEDRSLMSGGVECEAPPELREPEASTGETA